MGKGTPRRVTEGRALVEIARAAVAAAGGADGGRGFAADALRCTARPPEHRPARGRLRPARPCDLPAGSCLALPSADLHALGGLLFLLAAATAPHRVSFTFAAEGSHAA